MLGTNRYVSTFYHIYSILAPWITKIFLNMPNRCLNPTASLPAGRKHGLNLGSATTQLIPEFLKVT